MSISRKSTDGTTISTATATATATAAAAGDVAIMVGELLAEIMNAVGVQAFSFDLAETFLRLDIASGGRDISWCAPQIFCAFARPETPRINYAAIA